jgi:hypothetical protein
VICSSIIVVHRHQGVVSLVVDDRHPHGR